MSRHLPLGAIVLIALATPVLAQDDKANRARELEAEIAKLEAQLATLRAELGKLRLEDRPITDLVHASLKVGQVGTFTNNRFRYDLQVSRILDDNEVIVTCPDAFAAYRVILREPTKGLADDVRISRRGVYEVKETKRVGGSTYFVLEKIAEKPRPAAEEKRPDRPEEVAKRRAPKKPPEPKRLAIESAWEQAEQLVGEAAILTGAAHIKPDTRDRLLLTFRDPARATRTLCRVRIEKENLGPLAGVEIPAEGITRDVTIEATIGGAAGGELVLRDPKVTRAEARP